MAEINHGQRPQLNSIEFMMAATHFSIAGKANEFGAVGIVNKKCAACGILAVEFLNPKHPNISNRSGKSRQRFRHFGNRQNTGHRVDFIGSKIDALLLPIKSPVDEKLFDFTVRIVGRIAISLLEYFGIQVESDYVHADFSFWKRSRFRLVFNIQF